jgi:hypothetical protein
VAVTHVWPNQGWTVAAPGAGPASAARRRGAYRRPHRETVFRERTRMTTLPDTTRHAQEAVP